MSCKCQQCGKEYKVDLIIPDKIWEKVSPSNDESGLLCPVCIISRVEELIDDYRRINLLIKENKDD